jgi:hypothetical protein
MDNTSNSQKPSLTLREISSQLYLPCENIGEVFVEVYSLCLACCVIFLFSDLGASALMGVLSWIK